MTKTFKLSAIVFISSLWFIAIRIIANFISFSDNVTSWLFSFLMQFIGMGVIPFLLYKLWIKGDWKADFHVSKKIPFMNYVIAALIGLLLYYLTMGVSMIYQSFLATLGYTHVTTSVGTIYSGWEVLAMELLTVAVMPGLFEEFYNRGLLLSVFDNESPRKIIIILAVFFALFHQNIVQTGYTLVGGLIFAFMVVKTRSIWPGVIVHFINNGLSVIIDYSTQKGNYFGYLYGLYREFMYGNILIIFAGWIAAAFVIIWLLRLMASLNRKQRDAEEEQKRLADMSQSIYKLFAPSVVEEKALPVKTALWEYGLVIAAGVMSLAVTIFTFIWGLAR